MKPTWTLTDHACSACFGRVMRAARGPVVYRCANCGVEEPGVKGLEHPPICACEIKVGKSKKSAGASRFRCERVEPTLECPAEIVVREI